MSVLKQGILGGISGRIGNVVGSSWKGIPVIKSRPLSVSNPKTAPQVAQRTKMTNAVAFARAILAIFIKPLWDRFQTGMSGYNAFIAENIALFSTAMPLTPANLVTSKGKMAATAISVMTAAAASNYVHIEWVDDSGEGYKLSTDKVYVVVINEDKESVQAFDTGAARDDVSADVEFDEGLLAGETVYAYLSFLRDDGTVVGNNSYSSAVVS